MYRSMYVDKSKEPMVYIPMHNWTNRWLKPGIKSGIVVYSNCDEVALYDNDYKHLLAKQKRDHNRKYFVFDSVNVQSNFLNAVGYVNGKIVAKDKVQQYNLPNARNKALMSQNYNYNFLYRVNCGGDEEDLYGIKWSADNTNPKSSFYSTSWTNQFGIKPRAFASQCSPLSFGGIFRTYRYGKQELSYHFNVPNGEYLVQLYFVEPHFGLGNVNAIGWRVFDVAINNKVVIKDLDIYKEVGFQEVLSKTVKVVVKEGKIIINFPTVKAGQAIISAIAIATKNKNLKIPIHQVENVELNSTNAELHHWLNITDTANSITQQTFFQLPPIAFGADYVRWKTTVHKADFRFADATDVFVGDTNSVVIPSYLKGFEKQKETILLSDSTVVFVYKKMFKANENFAVNNEEGLATVFFQETSNIEPAYDLKPITTYKAIHANWSGKFVNKGLVDGKERIIFEKPATDNQLIFTMKTGVADVYSLTLSYNNPLDKHIKGILVLQQMDGTILKREAIEFTPTKKGKSNYIVTNTGSMINAGTYHLIVTAQDGENLSFNSLEVQ